MNIADPFSRQEAQTVRTLQLHNESWSSTDHSDLLHSRAEAVSSNCQ
jgi:hypothetical protein